jgi:type II secretory pathway component PulC
MSKARGFLTACGLAAFAAAIGCAGSATEATEPAPPAAPPAKAGEPAAPQRASDRAITRSALLAALDRGPGAFLQSVEVEAHFEEGAFAGWEVVDIRGGEDAPPVDIRRGDVIKSINGYGLERPEYLHAIFVELRTAGAIVVEGERAGQPFELSIPVVEE